MADNNNNVLAGCKQFCLGFLRWPILVPALLVIAVFWYCFLQPLTGLYFLAQMIFMGAYFLGWILLVIFCIGLLIIAKRGWIPFLFLLYVPASLFIGSVVQNRFVLLISCLTLLIPVMILIAGVIIIHSTQKQKSRGFGLNFIGGCSKYIFLVLLLSLPPFVIGMHLFTKYSSQFRQEAQIVIEKIDDYYAANNKYPETLKEIGYESETPSLSRPDVLVNYWHHEDDYYIELSKPRIFTGNWSYYSGTKEWVFD
jgi:hypothetical protein